MRFSSSQSLWSTTARNSSPASQADPMMSPSRWAASSVLGMMGKRLKYFRLEADTSWIQVLEPQLVFSQNNNVLGPAMVLIAQGPQLQHFAVDLLQAIDAQLPAHFLEKNG